MAFRCANTECRRIKIFNLLQPQTPYYIQHQEKKIYCSWNCSETSIYSAVERYESIIQNFCYSCLSFVTDPNQCTRFHDCRACGISKQTCSECFAKPCPVCEIGQFDYDYKKCTDCGIKCNLRNKQNVQYIFCLKCSSWTCNACAIAKHSGGCLLKNENVIVRKNRCINCDTLESRETGILYSYTCTHCRFPGIVTCRACYSESECPSCEKKMFDRYIYTCQTCSKQVATSDQKSGIGKCQKCARIICLDCFLTSQHQKYCIFTKF